jgi:signal transduction histidine kinase
MSSLAYIPSPELPLAPQDEQSLARAFATFTSVAASLERSYSELQSEVTRLRHELEETNRDLSQSLDANRRIQQHLNHIVLSLPCGVLVTDASGAISITNLETRRLLDKGSEDSLQTLNEAPEKIQELLARTPADAIEYEYCCRGQEVEWIAIHHKQWNAADGGGSIFILRDITESKRFEQLRESLHRREALAEISGLLAHEIRNPLGSLELYAGLLASSGLKAEQRKYTAHVQAGLRTLTATVNNVLHFYGEQRPGLAVTDLGPLLDSAVEFLRPLAQQAQVAIDLHHELDGVFVAIDTHRIEQVLLNLALNAFRSMPKGGGLTFSGKVLAACEQLVAWIEVTDQGTGISIDDVERIFDPGFTTSAGSPGLGLAVCKTIMEQHGGSIVALRRGETGATFRLEFPLSGASY